jgi:hypothetical protein
MKYANIIAAGHHNNSQFSTVDSVHKYGSTYLMRLLRDAFLKKGIEINTPDLNLGKPISFEIYVEGQMLRESLYPKYLLALENPFINTLNIDLEYCRQFNGVFSWNPSLASLPNFNLLMVPNELRTQPFKGFEERPIFSSLINANKRFPKSTPDDLYEERLKTIKWYEMHCPKDFHLYGLGWEKPSPAFTGVEKFRRRIDRLRTQVYGYKPFPSFYGSVEDKASVYSVSKFAFCYENTKNLENYITEKIFDSMMAGCVPIYWGANNIENYIPKECFIDRRDFENMESLHDFLKGIDALRYQSLQDAIAQFLQSPQMQLFDADSYVDTIVQKISNNLKMPRA